MNFKNLRLFVTRYYKHFTQTSADQKSRFNFKGQKQENWQANDGRKRYQNTDEEDAPLEMQPRDIRLKNIAYMGLYGVFSVIVIGIVIHRTNKNNEGTAKFREEYRQKNFKGNSNNNQ